MSKFVTISHEKTIGEREKVWRKKEMAREKRGWHRGVKVGDSERERERAAIIFCEINVPRNISVNKNSIITKP